MTPTDEQIAILDHIKSNSSNLMINALAGCGKTTTLDLVQAASPKKPVMCIAFNKKIASEMERRFPSTTTVRTFNGLGHRVWAKAIGKNIKLDPKKTQALLKEEIGSLKAQDRKDASSAYWEILGAVDKAKALGYVPEGKYPTIKRLITKEAFHDALEEKPSPFISSIIDALICQSIKASYEGLIDFNDQVFMSALFGGSFPRFPFTVVDEAQDLNPLNHEMLNKLVAGRVCFVGDPWQSVYGFRGAVQEGMQKLSTKFSCEEKDLSVSFRCPRVIVESARWRVPHFRWMKEGGSYVIMRSLSLSDIPEGAAILCRNNAPLFRLALILLSNKRSVQVAGSEIGPRIIRLLQKIGEERDDQETLIAKIDAWLNEKLEKSNAPATLADQAECLKVFASFGANLAQAVAYAEHLFKQQGTIKLSTVHKAKGLEWDTVFFLDRWLCRDDEQDLNLQYVAQTRSKNICFEVNSKDIR